MTRFLLMMPEYRLDRHMGGIGVRALDLANALSSFGEVTVVASNRCDLPDLPFEVIPDPQADKRHLIESSEAVLFFDMGNLDLLREAIELHKFIVVENAPPIEHLEYNYGKEEEEALIEYRKIVSGFAAQIAVADHVLLRSRVEYRTMLGCLTLLQRLQPADLQQSRTLEHLMTLVKIGFSRHEDRVGVDVNQDESSVLWTGGLWDYMAPEALVEGVRELQHEVPSPRLVFLYPPARGQGLRAEKLYADAASGHDFVTFASPAPDHIERGSWLESARVLACLALPGIENETCVRLRIRDALLYRRPILVDPFGATADYVEKSGIGLVTKSLSPDDVSAALASLLFDSETYASCMQALEKERASCLVDRPIERFVQVGDRQGWSPRRRRHDKLESLSHISALTDSPSGSFEVPFSV